MRILQGACCALAACTTLVSAQQSAAVIQISPVVHVAAPFSAVVRLPASLALKKGGIQAEAYLIDAQGGEIELAKLKLAVTVGGEVFLEHELEGLVLRYVVDVLKISGHEPAASRGGRLLLFACSCEVHGANEMDSDRRLLSPRIFVRHISDR